MSDSFGKTLLETLKAIAPVVIIVVTLQLILPGTTTELTFRFLLGAVLITLGLSLFLFGVKIAVMPMGDAVGAELPQIGRLPVILFWVFLLGFVATAAEPPVRVLAAFVEQSSQGEISGGLMILLMAAGIGCFLCLAVVRIGLRIRLRYIFWAGYALVLALVPIVSPKFLAIAFDASGVTTGPVTVPVILALGVGFTAVLGGDERVKDSFGLIGVASIGPILLVMIMGVILQ